VEPLEKKAPAGSKKKVLLFHHQKQNLIIHEKEFLIG